MPHYPLSNRRGWQPRDSREKGDLLGVTHVIIFLWQAGPTWQSYTDSFNSLNLAYQLNLIKLEQGLSINPTRKF
jgi:hypothetical protein